MLSFCVFGKRQLHRVRLRWEGAYPLSVNFIEKNQQNETRKVERIDSIKIAITGEPMDSNLNEAENFAFMGLHEYIAIFIDPATQLPIQVSGIIPSVGKADLMLRAVRMRPKSD